MFYRSGDIVQVLLIIALVWIVVFLICREIVCWYFKINARLDQQRQTNVLLEKLYKELCTQNGYPVPSAMAAMNQDKTQANQTRTNQTGGAGNMAQARSMAANPGRGNLDYERLLSMSVKQLNERGMLALEDHKWEVANACFSESLNKEPHNGEAHLGLLLAEDRQPDTDTWLEGIRRKNCSEMSGAGQEKIEVVKGFEEHVRSQEETYEIKGYLSRDEIHAMYSGIEHVYVSTINGWTRRMQRFESMVNAKRFRRVLKYTQGSLNQKITATLEEVMTYMNHQFESALEQDNRNLSRISNTAPLLIADADRKVCEMAVMANERMEEKKRMRREKLTRGINGTREQLGALLRSSGN